LLLNKEEKEQLVIKLAMKGLTTREIAKIAYVSLKDIVTIIRKYNGEEYEYQHKNPSTTSKAFQMFMDGKSKIHVAIDLNLESFEVISLSHDYLKLSNLDGLVTTYQYLGDSLSLFIDLFDKLRNEGIVTQPTMARLVQSAGKLMELEDEYLEVCDQIGVLNNKKSELEKEVEDATSLLAYSWRECSKLQKEM
jgi:hypothetical protein